MQSFQKIIRLPKEDIENIALYMSCGTGILEAVGLDTFHGLASYQVPFPDGTFMQIIVLGSSEGFNQPSVVAYLFDSSAQLLAKTKKPKPSTILGTYTIKEPITGNNYRVIVQDQEVSGMEYMGIRSKHYKYSRYGNEVKVGFEKKEAKLVDGIFLRSSPMLASMGIQDGDILWEKGIEMGEDVDAHFYIQYHASEEYPLLHIDLLTEHSILAATVEKTKTILGFYELQTKNRGQFTLTVETV